MKYTIDTGDESLQDTLRRLLCVLPETAEFKKSVSYHLDRAVSQIALARQAALERCEALNRLSGNEKVVRECVRSEFFLVGIERVLAHAESGIASALKHLDGIEGESSEKV
ncbi:hypothetical protein MOQ95_005380 [Salmonella enterica]|nr:hypothetical protein [Salmonella enterica]